MAENSAIEWTDHTFNPWIGCQKVSDGCKNCYAETLTKNRMGKDAWGPKGKRFMTKTWGNPRKWNAAAEKAGVPAKVFCCSMADVFEDWQGPIHDNGANGGALKWLDGAVYAAGYTRDLYPDAPLLTMQNLRDSLWPMVAETPWLRWLFLTKRPENVMRMTPESWREKFPSNVWIGTSVEDQKTADERIPHLLCIPASVRFLSCEPLLGPVDLTDIDYLPKLKADMPAERLASIGVTDPDVFFPKTCRTDALAGVNVQRWDDDFAKGVDCGGVSVSMPVATVEIDRVDWVICGGESGPHARPMHPDWARSLRDQCRGAGVPFFFKQWGEWLPGHQYTSDLLAADADATGSRFRILDWTDDGEPFETGWEPELGEHVMFRVGKKRAGRLLDGREWSQFPEVAV